MWWGFIRLLLYVAVLYMCVSGLKYHGRHISIIRHTVLYMCVSGLKSLY